MSTMRKPVSLIITALLICSAAAFASSTREARWIGAGPVQRQQLRELIRTKYPTLPEKAVGFLADRELKFFTQAVITRIQTVLAKHPEAVTTLPGQVMEDVHRAHPHLISQVAIAFWTEVSTSDPTFASDLKDRREPLRKWVVEQYPSLPEDVLAVVKEKHAALPARLRAEIADVVASTDARLPVDLLFDTVRLIRAQAPDALPGLMQARGRRERGRAFHELMADNPKLALSFWKMIDERYADRIYNVAQRAVNEIGPKEGKELASLALDVAVMIDAKHPDLPVAVIRHGIANRQQLANAMASAHPGFAQRLAAKLPSGILSEVVASVDRHAPGLRGDVKAAMQQRFPGLRDDLEAYLTKEFPGLDREVDAILK